MGYDVNFLWPELLALLLVPIVFAAWYIRATRKTTDTLQRYPGLTASLPTASKDRAFLRHLSPALFIAALTLLILAFARPVATVMLPTLHNTIILALDVSGSMRADDVQPNRLDAAKAAVKEFVELQPDSTRIGIVSFATAASVVQAPSRNHTDILNAVNQLQLQAGTAIGSAILISLNTIFPDLKIDLGTADFEPRAPDKNLRNPAANDPLRVDRSQTIVPPGSYKNAAIVLLSDGEATTGPDPIETSRIAAERGVRIFTVGIGTAEGQVVSYGGWSMKVALNEDALRKIASNTGGEYMYAATGQQLTDVYKSLSARFAYEERETEIGAILVGVAAVCALASALLALLRSHRIF
ncbi:VWA domain-containing protein [Noviherbaspirillum sp. CPCC 100848]|uniref:VWA domain-containing protein n=1 Tax=Noviherbaspirillum album TaxID=3080276 RepID=A0ABU6J8U3_9BURK|nr:VWA domain-containing protein [Noviherbaspirillum sp. CPCC 100848]MEC4720026.1 VWA domain-containing protein [Noviherbaspirillum sp. CPCC 100848]